MPMKPEPQKVDMFTDVKRDLSSERKVSLSNGNSLWVRRHDPYGLWTIHYEHGQLPVKYQGSYTLFEYALADINKYLSDKEHTITDVQTTYQANNLG